MSRRRKLIALLLLFLIGIVLFLVLYDPFPRNPNNNEIPPANGSSDNTNVPKFVVPENPLGTLGIVAAFAAAVGAFGLLKKGKYPTR